MDGQRGKILHLRNPTMLTSKSDQRSNRGVMNLGLGCQFVQLVRQILESFGIVSGTLHEITEGHHIQRK